MASLKEIKNRIASVKSTRQITSAMKMVSSAKLHKAQGQVESMWPYQQQLDGILKRLLAAGVEVHSPYVVARKEVSRVTVVIFSSNASLCGAYNANIIKQLESVVAEYRHRGVEKLYIYPVGKKVEEAVRKMGLPYEPGLQQLADKPSYPAAYDLADRLMHAFVTHEVDEIRLIYHHFKSAGSQILLNEKFLPLNLFEVGDKSTSGFVNNYIIEPSAEELLAQLLPTVLRQKMFTVALDAHTSEHAARMLAMQTATDNATDLIQDLTKQYNKGRQQAITNELLDIVAGSGK